MATLDNSVVVVAGGAGGIGEGIVAALLESGARIAVPSRAEQRLDALRDHVGGADRLLGVVGNVADDRGADRVRDEIVGTLGPPDAVVVAVGGWWSGSNLAEVPLSEWDAVLARNVRTHQVIASTYVPLLRGRPGALYTVINGDAAVRPVPGAGLASVAAAADLMAARVLGEEEREHAIQVLALVLGPVVTRQRAKVRPEWLTARQVGEIVTHRIAARSGTTGADVTEVLEVPDGAAAGRVISRR